MYAVYFPDVRRRRHGFIAGLDATLRNDGVLCCGGVITYAFRVCELLDKCINGNEGMFHEHAVSNKH